jgi:hypothetical protein
MDDDEWVNLMIGLLLLFILLGAGYVVYSRTVEARIYNKKFNTNYTATEFIFAGNTIKTLHEEKVPQRPIENRINATLELK